MATPMMTSSPSYNDLMRASESSQTHLGRHTPAVEDNVNHGEAHSETINARGDNTQASAMTQSTSPKSTPLAPQLSLTNEAGAQKQATGILATDGGDTSSCLMSNDSPQGTHAIPAMLGASTTPANEIATTTTTATTQSLKMLKHNSPSNLSIHINMDPAGTRSGINTNIFTTNTTLSKRPMSSYSKSRHDSNNTSIEPQLNLSVDSSDYRDDTNDDDDDDDDVLVSDAHVFLEPKTPTNEAVPPALSTCHNHTSSYNPNPNTVTSAIATMNHNHNHSHDHIPSIPGSESRMEMIQTPPPQPELLHQSHPHACNRANSSLFLPDNYRSDTSTSDNYTTTMANNCSFTTLSSATTPPLAPIPQSQSISFVETKGLSNEHGCGHDHDVVNDNENCALSSLQQPHFGSENINSTTTHKFHIQRSKEDASSYTIPPPQPLSSCTSTSMLYNEDETSFVDPNSSSSSMSSSSPLLFTSVPLDALHAIAGYLTPQEWVHVGLVSKDALIACREVFKKVKMHGFKCAVEVISSWELGEHTDARELAALYLKSGVPIYPAPYGHEYHTIVWRMKLEMNEMKKPSETSTNTNDTTSGSSTGTNSNNNNTSVNREDGNVNDDTATSVNDDTDITFVDRFYPEYFDSPQPNSSPNHPLPRSELFGSNYTYLEEKGMYWTNHHYRSKGIDPPPQLPPFLRNRAPSSSTAASPSLRRFSSLINRRFPRPHHHFPEDMEFFALFDEEDDAFHLDHVLEQGRIVGISDNVIVEPGNNNNVLNFDFGRRLIQEEDDRRSNRTRRNIMSTPTNLTTALSNGENYGKVKGVKTSVKCHKHLYDQHLHHRKAVHDERGRMVSSNLSLSVDFFHPKHLSNGENEYSNIKEDNAKELGYHAESLWDLQIYSYESEYNVNNRTTLKRLSPKSKESKRSNINQCQRPDSSVFEIVEHYEKRLQYLLECCEYAAFDECILDFWDEFFPITATIHFYDMYSPVPRSSYMRRFFSRPCPKEFGTVQCEIERIKVYNKSKGVKMTGRLFPTYEYRLFIRDRRHHPSTQFENIGENEDNQPRMDTILMTAKHKSRNQQTSSCTKLTSNRKGVNNYVFYMPHEEDINDHLDAVNESLKIDAYRQTEVPGSQFELGRLQSNFIGTEFQIFGPRNLKNTNSSSLISTFCGIEEKNASTLSENSTPKSKNPIKKRSQKFRLPKRIRRQSNDNDTNTSNNDHNRSRKGRISPWSSFSKKAVTCDEAIDAEGSVAVDKELGAITYTANLLGNRPRVMDVCVPKLSNETGLSIPFESNQSNFEEGSILDNLKRLSHQLLHVAPQNGRENDAVTADLDNLGLMSLQNRPPWWNVELGAFVLNFGGRVSVASVKNFQLCDRNDHENIMLQFGRIEGRHSFTMDFSYPLSPLQAFAIAVSSLQSKISFA